MEKPPGSRIEEKVAVTPFTVTLKGVGCRSAGVGVPPSKLKVTLVPGGAVVVGVGVAGVGVGVGATVGDGVYEVMGVGV